MSARIIVQEPSGEEFCIMNHVHENRLVLECERIERQYPFAYVYTEQEGEFNHDYSGYFEDSGEWL